MSDPIDLDLRRAARAAPFAARDASDFAGKAVPERDWLIPSILVRRSITLFAGDGGVGKSLMCLQLQVAAALGVDWMGLQIPRQMSSFGFYCEDDEEEIHRRLFDVLRFYGRTFKDLGTRLRFISRVGEENELVTFRGGRDNAKAARTSLFGQIEDEIDGYGHELVIIDTAADAFAGNENIRPQVRAFVTQIRRLALINNGGVILNSHPSKSAMADGSGFSGSTAWNGSVRNRLYLTTKKRRASGDEDDDQQQTNERTLKVMKSNYGPFGEKIPCKWEAGAFVRTDLSAGSNLLERLDHDRLVLDGARYLIERGSMLACEMQTRTSLAVLARNLPSCKDLSFKQICAAQDRLLAAGKLIAIDLGPKSKRRKYIRPSDMRYSSETGANEQ